MGCYDPRLYSYNFLFEANETIHQRAQLSQAIFKNDPLEVKKLLQNNPRLLDLAYKKWDKTYTPLFEAIKFKNLEIVKLLIENGANPNIVNDQNQSALMFALKEKQVEIAKLLIANKASCSFVNVKKDLFSSSKTSLLEIALNNDCESLVPLLIENGANPCDDKALEAAYRLGNFELIQFFTENGARVDAEQVIENLTKSYIIQLAIAYNDKQIDEKKVTRINQNTLMYLAHLLKFVEQSTKNRLLVNSLIELRLHPINDPENDKLVQKHIISFLEVLLDNGAYINASKRRSSGESWDPITQDSEATPLILAVVAKKYDIVGFLIGKKADVNKTNSWGFSPIMVAVFYKTPELVKLILEQKPNLYLRSSLSIRVNNGDGTSYMIPSGSTALKIAIQHEYFEICTLLELAGATI